MKPISSLRLGAEGNFIFNKVLIMSKIKLFVMMRLCFLGLETQDSLAGWVQIQQSLKHCLLHSLIPVFLTLIGGNYLALCTFQSLYLTPRRLANWKECLLGLYSLPHFLKLSKLNKTQGNLFQVLYI